MISSSSIGLTTELIIKHGHSSISFIPVPYISVDHSEEWLLKLQAFQICKKSICHGGTIHSPFDGKLFVRTINSNNEYQTVLEANIFELNWENRIFKQASEQNVVLKNKRNLILQTHTNFDLLHNVELKVVLTFALKKRVL